MARYAVIAAYVSRYCGDGFRLLDVGCGEGLLANYFDPHRLEHYTGLDLSQAALDKVRFEESKRTLAAADVESHAFVDGQTYDAIVLNEVLYYPQNPMQVLRKLSALVEPGGVIVVSMWHSPDPNSAHSRVVNAIWRAIDQGPWRGLDETAVTNIPTRRTWRIRVMTPKGD